MKVYIFFNGEECYFPPLCKWDAFRGLDTARLFLTCAESWARAGFDVVRLRTDTEDFEKTPFESSGRVSKEFRWYPAQYWQFIAKAKKICQGDDEFRLFVTIDVFNYGVGPEFFRSIFKHSKANCISFQREHFSMALVAFNWKGANEAESWLTDYDMGEIPALKLDEVSDETILREYMPHQSAPSMTFANNSQREQFRLLHFSRSATPSRFGDIPVA